MIAKPEHEIAYQDLCTLLARNNKLSKLEILAVASNMLGKLVALQDQRLVTPQHAMKIIADNIEIGNQQALEQLTNSKGKG